jgi:hypothetical protein
VEQFVAQVHNQTDISTVGSVQEIL